MTATTHSIEWLARFLPYIGIGGVASSLFVAWINSKIRIYQERRESHLEDIKNNVLLPIRRGLERFRPFVSHLTPIISVGHGPKEYRQNARVTELPREDGPLLVAVFPASIVGSTKSALIRDAQEHHFRDLIAEVDEFLERSTSYCQACESWVSSIAQQVLEKSGLAPFPNRASGALGRTYVMHYRLAVFAYVRLFGISESNLELKELFFYPEDKNWSLTEGSYTLAIGSKERLEILVMELDNLLKFEKPTAEQLRARGCALQGELTKICEHFDSAVNTRRLLGRCRLVTFL